jgi:hypothetical protein
MLVHGLLLFASFLPQDPTAPGSRRGNANRGVDPAAWDRPPLIAWQRNLADAEAISKATGKPLLVCVNLDGEPASEQFASGRYRDPEFARLLESYVPVIVSVNRHNPKDHDAQGRRIPCPRFGRVTCGEHVEAEPLAFQRWFKDNPVAPRHVAISAAGKELFDRFLDTDLRVVDEALLEHGKDVKAGTDATGQDAALRAGQEEAYLAADAAGRKQLLTKAASSKTEPFELIRLGMMDQSQELRTVARTALAQQLAPAAYSALADAMRAARDAGERSEIVALLEKLGARDPRARAAVVVPKALLARSAHVDVEAWRKALAGAQPQPPVAAPDEDTLDRTIDEINKKLRADPKDASLHLALGEATLQFARARIAAGKNPRLLLEDVKNAASNGEKNGGPADQAKALRARAAFLLGDSDQVRPLAGLALPSALKGAASADALELLWLVAWSNHSAIARAQNENASWPGEWLTDAHCAFQVMALHPLVTADHFASHVDLLSAVGAPDQALQVLDGALARHPDAVSLHQRFRDVLLADVGPEGLEAAYEAMVQKASTPALLWFHGYATITVAEAFKRKSRSALAKDAYGRAIARFEASVAGNAGFKDSANHYLAFAHAGRARMHMDLRDLDAAVADMLKAMACKADVADQEDGLTRTPRMTAQLLRDALERAKKTELIERYEQELQKVAPDLLTRAAR